MGHPGEPVGQAFLLAPGIKTQDVSNPLTFDDKLRIIEASVLGWQLDIAKSMLEGYAENPPIPHSGLAALSVVCSYPEMIWQFEKGESSDWKSKQAFREGLDLIFDSVDLADDVWVESINNLYGELRCGLYHAGRTKSRVITSSDFPQAISMAANSGPILINPHRLVEDFASNFREFVARVRESGEDSEEGRHFTATFDRQGGSLPSGRLERSP